MNIYLAGPMRGHANFNFPAFDYAAAKLRKGGHVVFSPAEHDRATYGAEIENNPTGDESKVPPGCTIRNCMTADTEWICNYADAIALLPGWETSRGFKAELALSEAIGLITIILESEYIDNSTPPPLNNARAVIKDRAPSAIGCAAPLSAAPTRLLPSDSQARKTFPMAAGLMDYFPDALAAVAHVSYVGSLQHNPGEPLHWARDKSTDQGDTLIRHFVERGGIDTDGERHSAKMAWRSLALLQEELEYAHGLSLPRGCTAAETPHTKRYVG